jgi:aspartyl-tRNA(Asn)/glutamyl-tRNA(Gln) amidotransferase subunit A
VLKLPGSLLEAQTAIYSGQYSVIELVNTYLGRIEASDLNAFNEVFDEYARARAKEVQAKIENKTAGRLAGMVIGFKDVISIKGQKVTSSSKILENFTAVFNATVTTRLLEEDVIIIGRLNCDEFAMGGSNENSAFGNVLNPVDKSRVPGGSSGGSAAAVAADLCLAALGTDTGGSIRQPASFCGVVGLKPTYGRVSRHGLLAYASSFDQIGPITKNIEDAALLLEIMAGSDDYDSTASRKEVPAYSQSLEFNGKVKIGYLKECIESDGLHPEIKNYFNSLIKNIKAQGHEVFPVSFPFLDYLIPTYYVLTTAEASSNLSRYDGIHFGYRSPEAAGIENTYIKSRSEGFGPEVKIRIMLGTFVLSSGYYDAYYAKAQKVRRVIKDATSELFKSADFLLLPTTPTPAFKLGENTADPITMYLQDIFTVQANLAGIPAVSLPMAKTADNLPFGIQLMAPSFEEQRLLAFSKQLFNTLS